MAAITSAVVGAGTALYGASQSRSAAKEQVKAGDRAIASQEATAERVRQDLQPFAQAGQQGINPLVSRLTDPAEIGQITSDPLYRALFDSATQKISASRAAGGKLGSGDTLQDLTTASLGIGSDIFNNRTNQLFNLVSMGQNAAAGQGTATLNTGSNIADLMTQTGNVNAAGKVGMANAVSSGVNTGIGLYDLLRES